MELFNIIRGHFALFIGKPLYTPSKNKPFHIISVNQKEGDWQIELKISSGKSAKVYISDILRVYTFIVSSNQPLTEQEISNHFQINSVSPWDGKLITQGRIPYILPLLSTFTDIEVTTEPKYKIRFVPLRETS